jgi:hypothetical protein
VVSLGTREGAVCFVRFAFVAARSYALDVELACEPHRDPLPPSAVGQRRAKRTASSRRELTPSLR